METTTWGFRALGLKGVWGLGQKSYTSNGLGHRQKNEKLNAIFGKSIYLLAHNKSTP